MLHVVFFVVGVNPSSFLVAFLGLLNFQVFGLHATVVVFHGSVCYDLLAANGLLLSGVGLLLSLFLVLHHGLLLHLNRSLEHHGLLSFVIESLEVVGLDSMGSQHAHFSLRVFSHEISVVGVVDFSRFSSLSNVVSSLVFVFLLLHKNAVNILSVLFIIESKSVVL